jgi:uncharacterized protein (TIGR02001 family)
MLKKTLMTAAVASTLMTGASLASAESGWSTSANVALTTDYKFRGISQSNENPALQGGFDLSHESGFYIGTWGSTVDFDTDDGDYDGSLELDIYGGFSGSFNDDWGYDVGVLYYAYPGDDGDDGDFLEVYGSVSWKDLTVGVNYSDDYYAETDKATYIYANYSYGLPMDISLDLHVGYQMLEEDGGFLSSDEDAYTDYSIGLTKSFMDLDFSLSYVGTDLDDDDVFGTDWGDGVAVFAISKSM